MTNIQLHSTTFKVRPDIGNGLRVMAAINGDSVADVAQQAVSRILRYHRRNTSAVNRPASRGGRPGTSIQQAANAIMRSKQTKNEAIPTRLTSETAKELAELAQELGTQMSHLAEQGALHLLRKGPEAAKAIARLSGDSAYERTYEALQQVAEGSLSEDEFKHLDVIGANAGAKAALSRRRSKP